MQAADRSARFSKSLVLKLHDLRDSLVTYSTVVQVPASFAKAAVESDSGANRKRAVVCRLAENRAAKGQTLPLQCRMSLHT